MRPVGRRGARKRRTRQHVIADLAVNHVERHVLCCGYLVERMQNDYGVDLTLFTFDRHGLAEDGEVYIQVKATDRIDQRAGGGIALPIERGDLE